MAGKMAKAVFIALLAGIEFISNACTIFMANDGQHVWVGNNEDEIQSKKYRTWFYPARKGNYGYMTWTELSFGKLLYGLSYLNPQGGLNEHGLFMDYTVIDDLPVPHDPQKKDRKKQVVTDILKKCRSVEEALGFIKQYNLVKLKSVQLFIGDAGGDYATVHGSYVVRKTVNNFAITNYCINNNFHEPCWRRDIATHYLESGRSFQLADIVNILEKSTQKNPNSLVSNYSMAVDLKAVVIHLYYKNDFTTGAVISLAEELKKGKHHRDLVDYFPLSITPVLQKEYAVNGINAAIHKYKSLRNEANGQYNFKNEDGLNFGILLIEKGQAAAAIQFLEFLESVDTGNINIFNWLGVACRKENNIAGSDKYFGFVLQQNPDDYLATLFGKQQDQKITFKLNDFEGAETVSLIGEFTNWEKNPVKMIKQHGVWTCEVVLPRGENQYKFIVNQEYVCDRKNRLHVVLPDRIRSLLYTW
jgi:hypothetical protein